MFERRLPPGDLARTRFATSPLWETVASVRALQAAPSGGPHGAWAAPIRERLADARFDLSRLLALVPPPGAFLADFLTPTPPRRRGVFAAEVAAVRGSDLDLVVRDLRGLRAEGATSRPDVVDAALADPARFVARVADDLEAYWELTVARVWERLEGLAEADIAWRLERMAAGGTLAVLDTLHPRVRMDGPDLVVSDFCHEAQERSVGAVVLVPCAFAWPDLLYLEFPGEAVTLSYSPRGVGNLWRDVPDATGTPLADLVGRTRASAMLLLDLPMTTGQLACHLDLAPPTANEHLKILQRAGLVAADRRGRRVLYSRTPLGAELARGVASGA